MSVLQAVYFDGKDSRPHPVSVMVAGGRMKVVGRDVNGEFDARGVRRSLRIANTPRWLYLPGGGACVTSDNGAVDRMTRDRRYEMILHRWESRPAYAVVAIAMVVAALWILIDRVLPVAVESIAARIPVEAEAALGRETLEGIDQYVLQPTKLSASRQARLRERFDALARAGGETVPYRLEFRSSPMIGANAFALPSGIIVMTDELVKLARNDEEVLAVLAHELGHVRHRHTMRRLLESSATALIIAGVTGDIASATSLAAAAPTLLLQTKYSREHEREADLYAIELMGKGGIEPRHFAAILGRLEGDAPRRGRLPGFLASHPPTEEREALARGGAAGGADDDDTREAEKDAEAAPLQAKPALLAVDPVQRHIVALLDSGDYAELERLIGGYQRAFEADAALSPRLENAFAGVPQGPAGRAIPARRLGREIPFLLRGADRARLLFLPPGAGGARHGVHPGDARGEHPRDAGLPGAGPGGPAALAGARPPALYQPPDADSRRCRRASGSGRVSPDKLYGGLHHAT
jgi:Zn-dependent protease with chaperone function